MCKDMALISIIIPCYNCSEWLDRTFKSLINQTHKDFEVIFIDDGSEDDSFERAKDILENSELSYKLIKQKNLGVSISRNNAIREAKGHYIYFLDSDDYIDINFCKCIYEMVTKHNTDMVFFNYKVYENGKYKYFNNKQNSTKIYSKDVLKDILNRKFSYNMCSFVVKREVIENNRIKFTENIRYGEDHEFIIKCLCNVEFISIIDKSLFTYCKRTNSAVTSFSIYRLDSIYSAMRVENYINSIYKDITMQKLSKKYVAEKLFYNIIAFSNVNSIRKIDKKTKCRIFSVVKEYKYYFKYLNYMELCNLKRGISKFLIYVDINLFVYLLSGIKKIKNIIIYNQ